MNTLLATLLQKLERKRLMTARLRAPVPVREPLVLISQIQRSGGTLLSQLFDAHPECHVHPFELQIGRPKKQFWPKLDARSGADRLFEMLYEAKSERFFLEGYSKTGRGNLGAKKLLFDIPPDFQRKLFLENMKKLRANPNQRQILDAYLTSYFNGWLNNHNLNGGKKKWAVAFCPGFIGVESSVTGFFNDYPDGRVISIIREPYSWYASMRSHQKKYQDIQLAAADWISSTEAALSAKERHNDKVVIIYYEQLISQTEAVMRRLCRWMNIHFEPCLLRPTFNGEAITPNSSFPLKTTEISPVPLKRYKTQLTKEQIDYLTGKAVPVYEAAKRRAPFIPKSVNEEPTCKPLNT